MQNKGAIRAIAIIFALIFLYQLSFTVVSKIVERRAEKNAIEQVFPKDANGQDIAVSESIQDAIAETMQKRSMDESQAKNYLKEKLENSYLDSMNTVNVYNLGFKKYTYRDAKEKEINLGLDLKGGMNVTLEVSVKDIVKATPDAEHLDGLAVITTKMNGEGIDKKFPQVDAWLKKLNL